MEVQCCIRAESFLNSGIYEYQIWSRRRWIFSVGRWPFAGYLERQKVDEWTKENTG